MGGVEPQQGGGGPLPDGDYIVRITAASERTANSGTPGFEFEMEVLVGDHAGRKVWDRLWFTDKTKGMVLWRMECAGIKVPDGDFTLEPDHFIGKRVQVTTRQEPYEGKDGSMKTRAEVKGWNPPPGGGNGVPGDPLAADPGSPAPPRDDDDAIPF
jgi:hypothetical protein